MGVAPSTTSATKLSLSTSIALTSGMGTSNGPFVSWPVIVGFALRRTQGRTDRTCPVLPPLAMQEQAQQSDVFFVVATACNGAG